MAYTPELSDYHSGTLRRVAWALGKPMTKALHTVFDSLDLIVDPQVFVPAANQEIVRVCQRLRLEDHETVVIKDRAGRHVFRRGSNAERSFFLDPYSELSPEVY